MTVPTIEQILSLTLSKSSGKPEDQTILSSIVEHSIRRTNDGISIIDAHGKTRTNASGQPMTFADLLTEMQSQRPELFKDTPGGQQDIKQTVQVAPSGHKGLNFTESMKAEIAARNSTHSQKAQAAEVAALGNPWSKATRNLTRQYQIENLDPALAARLKAQAGVAA